ncbi:queuine tRNA-ribosyltransferase family protein, partial [Francisella tularensis subsp. holarctica]
IHNLTFYQNLMKSIRKALDEGRFSELRKEFLASYK